MAYIQSVRANTYTAQWISTLTAAGARVRACIERPIRHDQSFVHSSVNLKLFMGTNQEVLSFPNNYSL